MIHIILLIFFLSGSTAENGPLVETSLGKIRGFYKKSFEGRLYSAFEGIPYAKPPVGDLRFEAPGPISAWSDVLNASTSYICKQIVILPYFANNQEDCLYLNVYVPKSEPTENDSYDVIVNIHAGAFMMGSPVYAGPKCFMDRDIIYVTINYRLGILGFLSAEDEALPGNNGLKDQQMALKWVQSHIKSFGGNPKSVTLMGLSAGGASVHFHYFSPQSRGLFHRGISQSGNALMPWAMQENALEKTKKLAKSFGCLNSNVGTLVDCLKAVDADDLMNETMTFYELSTFPLAPFAPVVEVNSNSAFLTKHPYHQLEDGEVYDVPWLSSITTAEGLIGMMFINKTLDEIESNWNDWSEHYFDYKHVCPKVSKKEVAEKIKSFYFNTENNKIEALVKIFSDRLFNVDFEIALEMQTNVVNSSIYAALYGYTKCEVVRKMLNVNVEGAIHGSESALIHDSAESNDHLSESDIRMKNVLLDLVTSFAKYGKPNSNQVEWRPFTPANPMYLLINNFDDLNMTEIPKLSPKEFWNSLGFMENHRIEKIKM